MVAKLKRHGLSYPGQASIIHLFEYWTLIQVLYPQVSIVAEYQTFSVCVEFLTDYGNVRILRIFHIVKINLIKFVKQ